MKILRKAPFESDRKDIEDLIYNKHLSDQEIADLYGVAKDTIWSRRLLWDLPSGSEQKELHIKDSITQYWVHGYTVNEMAEALETNTQLIYNKMEQYNIRQIPRYGIPAPVMSLTDLRQDISELSDGVVVVTHNRQPKWVLVPIEEYQDLRNGVFSALREEA